MEIVAHQKSGLCGKTGSINLHILFHELYVFPDAQAIRLKKLAQEGALDAEQIQAIMTEYKPNQQEQYKFKREDIRKFFPRSYTDQQVYEAVFKALELLKRQRDRNRDNR